MSTAMRHHLRPLATGAAIVAVAALFPVLQAAATAQTDSVEVRLLELINQGRARVGKGPEVMHAGLRTKAQGHSSYQSQIRSLTHNGFSTRIQTAAPDPYESNGAPDDGFGGSCENVAYYYPGSAGASNETVAQKLYSLWYNSSGHRNCMFDAYGYGLNAAGVGIYLDSRGYWWATLESVRDRTPPGTTTTPTPTPTPTPTTPTSGTWTRIDQAGSGTAYTSGWTVYSDSSAWSGGYRRSTTAGAYARYAFTGTGVRWIGIRSPNGGIAEVRLDGALVATVDQYRSGSTALYQQVMFERTGLTNASHSLEVRVKGTKNPSAADYRTYVDAFERRS